MAEFTNNIVVSTSNVYELINPNTPIDAVTTAIAHASAMIESITGVFLNSADREVHPQARDAVWIRKAIAFQAAWMLEQPDALSRMGVSSLSQEGISVNATDALTFVLAPMAKRTLQNCSWTQSGTVHVEAPRVRGVDILVSDAHPWEVI